MPSERVTLVICDGFGISPETQGNAVLEAKTPTLDYLLANYPAMRLLAAGTEVGLDMGEPGNSEVGHLTLGTGQVLPQALQIINTAIKNESFAQNRSLITACEQVKKTPNATLHIVGLMSAGGVHGHIDHVAALLQLAAQQGVTRVALHVIADGRDSPKQVVLEDSKKLLPLLKKFSFGVIASVSGRFYGMDRDCNWERTDAAYWAIMGRGAHMAHTFETAVQEGYGRGESDESLQSATITDEHDVPLSIPQANDVIVVTNYRPDRIRQLTTRLITTTVPLTIITMTDYFLGDAPTAPQAETTLLSAFPLPKATGTLADVLADAHKSQLHIAETEKYAHITYFFNGHEESKRAKEEWLLLPSVKVDSFARAPEMSAKAIVAAYVNAQKHHAADFTTINLANMDMVGHTGDYKATVIAVEAVDTQLKPIVDLVEKEEQWLLITADHGNAEQMINPVTGDDDKEHTTNPVPFLLVHSSLKDERNMTKVQLAEMSATGMLADVAPTILEIFDIEPSPHMVGTSLFDQLTHDQKVA